MTFTKSVQKINAFLSYLKEFIPPALHSLLTGFSGDIDVTLLFSGELTDEEKTIIKTVALAYQDPPYWLEFDHTENHFLTTPFVSSISPVVVSSFIISPYALSDADTVLGSMKTIVNYDIADVSVFADWDESITAMTVTVELYNHTEDQSVAIVVQDASSVAAACKAQAIGGATGPVKILKSIHIYGLKDANPCSDCIWQFKVSVSDVRLSVALNGLQRLFYLLQ